MDKDTFSAMLKEELCHEAIKSRKKAFWEAFALFKFLGQKGKRTKMSPKDDGLFPKSNLRPFLMRRLFNLVKYISGASLSFSSASIFKESQGKIRLDFTPWITAGFSEIRKENVQELRNKEECRRGFLRGAFLAKGYASFPTKNRHLEISLPQKRDAALVKTLMEKEGLKPGLLQRRAAWIVYLKDSDDISQFMKVLGATRSILEYENVRVQKEVKSRVQRLVNMDGANVERTVDAAMRQLRDIQFIDDSMGLNKLPKALSELAFLRRENPDLSMEELGELFDPPISKSAVNHRFRRIAKIARKLRDSGQG